MVCFLPLADSPCRFHICHFFVHREGATVRLLDEKEVQEAKKWDSMNLKQKIGDWGFRHQYSIILGGWAGSLAIAGAIISRQK